MTALPVQGRTARTKLRFSVISMVLGWRRVEGMGNGFGKPLGSAEGRVSNAGHRNVTCARRSAFAIRLLLQPHIGHAFYVLGLGEHVQWCHATQFKDSAFAQKV